MEAVVLQRVSALGLSGGVGIIGGMTMTPELTGDGEATPGVEARNATFRDAVAAALRPTINDFTTSADGRLGLTLETLIPGPALAALLSSLDPALLTPVEQLAFLDACERLTAWVASVQNTGLVAFTGPAPVEQAYVADGRSQVLIDARRTELATHLLWSEGTARSRVATARALATDLPETRAGLEVGAVSMLRATAVAEGAAALTSGVDTLLEHAKDGVERVELLALRRDMLTAFESRVTDYATGHDTGRTRSHVTRTIARLDPAGWAARRARAIRTHSNVMLRHLPDGLSELTATLPTEQAIACANAIDATARALQTQDRQTPIGVHRTTALHQLLTAARSTEAGSSECRNADHHVDKERNTSTAGLRVNGCSSHTDAPSTDGITTVDATRETSPRLQLNVTIDLPTLLALRQGVGEITGAGPIPAAIVRELVSAGGASIRWLTTSPSGAITDASAGYRIPEALRALIISRDRTCAMPNCSIPAMACEIDHLQPYDTGGETTASNLQALCKRHHQTKTHGTPVSGVGAPPANLRGADRRHQHDQRDRVAARSPLDGHALADLAPLHFRLAELQQQLDELTELGLTDTHLETHIADLDTRAMRLFDDTLDQRLADALPSTRNEGAMVVMLRHTLQRHHGRTCQATTQAGRAIHSLQHCPTVSRAADTPPF